MKEKKPQTNNFLLPPPPEAGTEGRYSARPDDPRPWSPIEDLLLFPAVAACKNEYSYRTTCRALCQILGREPAYAAAARPPLKTILNDCVALIERRTVTHTLTGVHRDVLDLAGDMNCGFYPRDLEDVTVGEFNKILIPYRNKIKAKTPVATFQELMCLLGRSNHHWEQFEKYTTFSGSYPLAKDGPTNSPSPAGNFSNLCQFINELRSAVGSKVDLAWAKYNDFLLNLEK